MTHGPGRYPLALLLSECALVTAALRLFGLPKLPSAAASGETRPNRLAHSLTPCDPETHMSYEPRKSPPAESAFATHTEAVARLLSDAILSGDIAPGTRLNIRALSEGTGLGPTPIREALANLELGRASCRERGGQSG